MTAALFILGSLSALASLIIAGGIAAAKRPLPEYHSDLTLETGEFGGRGGNTIRKLLNAASR
jgi:hypothetical protein